MTVSASDHTPKKTLFSFFTKQASAGTSSPLSGNENKHTLQDSSIDDDSTILSSKRKKVGQISSDSDMDAFEENALALTCADGLEPESKKQVSRSLFQLLTSSQDQDVEENLNTSEERYHWILNRLDGSQRPQEHPEFDKKTIYIPPEQWKKFTPFEKQFWEIKSKHFDIVIFFKKGKFYELYDVDAELSSKLFDLRMSNRVNMSMSGVPEQSFSYWASKFIHSGYPIGKVEQMETTVGKSIRDKSSKGGDKILKRELTSILTPGTLSDPNLLASASATYCMALCIRQISSTSQNAYYIGFAILDASTSHFQIGSVPMKTSWLETILVSIKPAEILVEKSAIKLFMPGNDLFDLKRLCSICVPLSNIIPINNAFDTKSIQSILPTAFYEQYKCELDSDAGQLALLSLQGLLGYVDSLHLEGSKMLLYSNIEWLHLNHSSSMPRSIKMMTLDAHTIRNLDLFENGHDGSTGGTLYSLLNSCASAFGQRKMALWIRHPLVHKEAIEERLDMQDYLESQPEMLGQLRHLLGALPDLERALSRIHRGSSSSKEFLNVVQNLIRIGQFSAQFISSQTESQCPKCPNIMLDWMQSIYKEYANGTLQRDYLEGWSIQIMKSDTKGPEYGDIIPLREKNSKYNSLCQDLEIIEKEFQEYLEKIQRRFHPDQIVYRDILGTNYQLEISSSVSIPEVDGDNQEWILMSKTKSVNRYWTPWIKKQIQRLEEQKEYISEYLKSFWIQYAELFASTSLHVWRNAVDIMGSLDCIQSFLYYRNRNSSGNSLCCRPMFVESEVDRPIFEAQGIWHPCHRTWKTLGTTNIDHSDKRSIDLPRDFVPNDVHLGGDNGTVMILTGPNMGGKSTMLRQVCLAILMAQIGCCVPAKSCKMSVFDKIFTRIGAQDDIDSGHSTFLVELNETKTILLNATKRSFVILDELGRGTSTVDGLSIAWSVVHELCRIGCPTLFTTHYRSLTHMLEYHPQVSLYHMSSIVDSNNSDRIVFLYKLIRGVCPNSYGMNVARLAGIPSNIISRAQALSIEQDYKTEEYHNQGAKMPTTEHLYAALLALRIQFIQGPQQKNDSIDLLNYLLTAIK
jgi:DNA mismatch repair protein MSH6